MLPCAESCCLFASRRSLEAYPASPPRNSDTSRGQDCISSLGSTCRVLRRFQTELLALRTHATCLIAARPRVPRLFVHIAPTPRAYASCVPATTTSGPSDEVHSSGSRNARQGRRSNLCAGVTSGQVGQALKKVARLAGVPVRTYSTHSIRIGGATALLNGAADSLAIKLLSR
ncbi:hypothetical protein PybrP1_006935 [[Pythium] brassicae (nom. inval.)]|nr:hypothetical protein PybrP1_006935 [[Pythium] brassicae (nom. inval.)]